MSPKTQTSSKFGRNTTTKTVIPPNISTRHPFLYDGVDSLVHLLHDTSRDCEDGTMDPMTLLRSKRVCVWLCVLVCGLGGKKRTEKSQYMRETQTWILMLRSKRRVSQFRILESIDISFPTGVFAMVSLGVSRYKGWNVWFVQMYLYYWYRSRAMVPCDSDVPWLWLDILFSMTFGLDTGIVNVLVVVVRLDWSWVFFPKSKVVLWNVVGWVLVVAVCSVSFHEGMVHGIVLVGYYYSSELRTFQTAIECWRNNSCCKYVGIISYSIQHRSRSNGVWKSIGVREVWSLQRRYGRAVLKGVGCGVYESLN